VAELLRPEHGPRDNPDTVDDFFRLNARFLQIAALPYLANPCFFGVLDLALHSVSLEHRDANASVNKFLYDLVYCGRKGEDKPDYEARSVAIKAVLTTTPASWAGTLPQPAEEEKFYIFGARLIRTHLHASTVSPGLPSYTFPDVGDVWMELMMVDRVSLCLWLQDALLGLSSAASASVSPPTRCQLVQFHTEVTRATSPREVSDAIKQFSRLWR